MTTGGFEPGVDAATRRALLDIRRELATRPRITVDPTTAPADPALGDLWFDTPILKVWDGSVWATV